MVSEGATMRVSGNEAVYRGVRHPVLFVGSDWVAVPYAGPGQGDADYPDAVGFDPAAGWVKIARSALDSDLQVQVVASWRGQDVHVLNAFDDETLGVLFQGDPDFAREQGLSGDQYNGWGARVQESELSDVRVE